MIIIFLLFYFSAVPKVRWFTRRPQQGDRWQRWTSLPVQKICIILNNEEISQPPPEVSFVLCALITDKYPLYNSWSAMCLLLKARWVLLLTILMHQRSNPEQPQCWEYIIHIRLQNICGKGQLWQSTGSCFGWPKLAKSQPFWDNNSTFFGLAQ